MRAGSAARVPLAQDEVRAILRARRHTPFRAKDPFGIVTGKADLTTVTPESNQFCTAWWDKEQMYSDGAYTPYAFKGMSVVFSGTIGGGNWGGVAFNPPLGLIFGAAAFE